MTDSRPLSPERDTLIKLFSRNEGDTEIIDELIGAIVLAARASAEPEGLDVIGQTKHGKPVFREHPFTDRDGRNLCDLCDQWSGAKWHTDAPQSVPITTEEALLLDALDEAEATPLPGHGTEGSVEGLTWTDADIAALQEEVALGAAWKAAEAAVTKHMPGAGFSVGADGPGYRADAGHPEWHGGHVVAWSVDDPELVGSGDAATDASSPSLPAKALRRLVSEVARLYPLAASQEPTK